MFRLLYLPGLVTILSVSQRTPEVKITMLGAFSIFALSTLLSLPPYSWRMAAMADSLSVTPEYEVEGPTNFLTPSLVTLDSALEGLDSGGTPGFSGQHADLLDRICPADSPALDLPQQPTREQNIGELELMLSDNDLGEATNKLWLAFYGHEVPKAASSVEELSAQFLELVRESAIQGQDGIPSGTHKPQLFFLWNLLSNKFDTNAHEGGLKAFLLDKLRSIAGVVLGGDAITPQVGQVRVAFQDVHHHMVKQEGHPESHNSQLPRSIVPIVGARNPLMLGLFWNLLIAYTGFDSYFGEDSITLPFFSWPSLLASLGGQSSSHIDAMCSVQRSRSLTEKFFKWRSPRGIQQNRRHKRVSSLRESSHRTFCELIDRLISSLGEFVAGHVTTLAAAGVPVELGISPLQNMKRLHAETCLPGEDGHILAPCIFEESRLALDSQQLVKMEDDTDQQIRHSAQAELLKQAHTTISGLGALDCKLSSRQGGNLTGADWGLLPRPVNEQIEEGKDWILERLNLAVATMLTTSSLDNASNYWLAFDRRNFKRAAQDFKKHTIDVLRSVGMEAIGRRLLQSSGSEISDDEVQAAASRLKDLRAVSDGMRVALALYAILPSPLSVGGSRTTMLSLIQLMLGDTRSPLMLAVRDTPFTPSATELAAPLPSPTHMWVFAFLSSREGYQQQKEAVFQKPTWARILYSHGFVPGFVRNIFFKSTAGMLKSTREIRIQKARKVLRERLPSTFFDKLLKPFTFTVHSAALLQVINFHYLKHDKTVEDLKRFTGEERPHFLQDQPISARMDDRIKSWATHGLAPTLLESHADFSAFKRAWSKIDLNGLPLPDLTDWWSRLNYIVVQALESYLVLEKHLEFLEDTVFTLVSDSLRKLKADAGQTLFFTRIAHQKRQGPLQRLWEGAKKSLMGFLYRSPGRQHGIWFGVTVDFEQLHDLLGQLKLVIEAEPRLTIKINMQEALLREVETRIRVEGSDISRVPPLVERNMGMLGVRRAYGTLSEGLRDTEFQRSMCIDHCRGLWQMALSTMLPSMLSPDIFRKYEKAFGTPWALEHLSDPALVNSRRMVLKSDAALNFFDHSTPKEVREELKGLESGQASMFAYYMLFSSRAHQVLGNHYLGLYLRQQAPFMGNMVVDWISTRRKHAVAAIVSSFVLTFMGIYAVMSFVDILQNLIVSGAPPPFDCLWNPVFGEMACSPVPGGASLGTAWATAIEQVFLIGLFSGTAGGFSLFLTINSAIAVVVNQSKTLMRLQMCLGSAISRLLRRGKRSFSRIREYFIKRSSVKRVMLQRAVAGMKAGSSTATMSNSETLEAADQLLDRLTRTGRANPLKASGGKPAFK